MPKIINHPTNSALFLKNDVPYVKNVWEIYTTDRINNDVNDSSTEILKVGIRHVYRKEVLQSPVAVSSYDDVSDNPYTNIDLLLADLVSSIGQPSSSSGGGGGSTDVSALAKELTLLEIDSKLEGSLRTPSTIDSTTDGSTLSGVQSVSISFLGENGTISGVNVPDGATFSYTPNKGEDTVDSISYTVPTSGEQRVIISYVNS